MSGLRQIPRLRPVVAAAVGLALLGGSGCKQGEPAASSGGPEMALTITSPDIAPGGRVPVRYTGDGEDVSPPLAWSGVPEGAKELALIVDDPDARMPQPWVHWVIYNIPAGVSELPAGVKAAGPAPGGARQGLNSSGGTGYRGPAPPPGHGVHHYHFRLYALDSRLDLRPGAQKKALLDAMAGHVLAEGELVGTYQR